MKSEIIGVTDAVADGNLSSSARIAIAKDGVEALRKKLEKIALDLSELNDRIEKGEPVTAKLSETKRELQKLRVQTEAKLTMLSKYVAAEEAKSPSP